MVAYTLSHCCLIKKKLFIKKGKMSKGNRKQKKMLHRIYTAQHSMQTKKPDFIRCVLFYMQIYF